MGASEQVRSGERCVTVAGEVPVGDGWVCVHSWANWEGCWWLWQRFVREVQS